MLTRKRVLAAKIESTPGTAESITASDGGILIIDAKFEADINMGERKVLVSSLSSLPDIPGERSAVVTFKTEMKGAGAAYSSSVQPALGKYLKACGFAETVDDTSGSETVIYTPLSSGIPTLTMWLYEDGIVKKMKGAQGTVKFSGEKGAQMYADFSFSGVFDGVSDASMIVPTFETSVPPILLSALFTIDSYAAKIGKLDFDMGNSVQVLPDISTSTGFSHAMLTSRKPTGTIDPEMVTVATYDWYGKWLSGNLGALSVTIGSTQYNKYTITAPKVQYTKVAEGDNSGIATGDISFKLVQNTGSGDDEIQVEFS